MKTTNRPNDNAPSRPADATDPLICGECGSDEIEVTLHEPARDGLYGKAAGAVDFVKAGALPVYCADCGETTWRSPAVVADALRTACRAKFPPSCQFGAVEGAVQAVEGE